MKGHGSKFGRRKEAAVAALLTAKNHAEAARIVGIDLSTLKRWMRLPEFIEEYRRARWEVVEQGYARAEQNTPAAASVLRMLMADSSTPASSRIRARVGRLWYRPRSVGSGCRDTRGGFGARLGRGEKDAVDIGMAHMANVLRRLRKLEVRLTDSCGLVPHSQKWLHDWEQRIYRMLTGEEPGEPGCIPLEAYGAVMDYIEEHPLLIDKSIWNCGTRIDSKVAQNLRARQKRT